MIQSLRCSGFCCGPAGWSTDENAPHDDGRWYRAELLSQHRVVGLWRVTVAYSDGVGFTYWRAMPADWCRALAEPDAWHGYSQ